MGVSNSTTSLERVVGFFSGVEKRSEFKVCRSAPADVWKTATWGTEDAQVTMSVMLLVLASEKFSCAVN